MLTSSFLHFSSTSRRERQKMQIFLFLFLCFTSFSNIFSSCREHGCRASLGTSPNFHCSCQGHEHFKPNTISHRKTQLLLVKADAELAWKRLKTQDAKEMAVDSDKSKMADQRSWTLGPISPHTNGAKLGPSYKTMDFFRIRKTRWLNSIYCAEKSPKNGYGPIRGCHLIT